MSSELPPVERAAVSPSDASGLRQVAARELLKRRLTLVVASGLLSQAVLLGVVAWLSLLHANRTVEVSFAETLQSQRSAAVQTAEHVRDRQIAAARSALQSQCNALARVLAEVAEEPVLEGDAAAIERVCRELRQHPDVAGAGLVGMDGELLGPQGAVTDELRRLLDQPGNVIGRARVASARTGAVTAFVIASDVRLRADRASIAADLSDINEGFEGSLNGLAQSLQVSLRRTKLVAIGSFAAVGLGITALVLLLVRRRIGLVASAFERLSGRVTRLIDDLSLRSRELEDARAGAEAGRELLDAVLQRMGEAVVVVDADAIPLLWNRQARELLGLTVEETQAGARRLVESLVDADGVSPLPLARSPLVRALAGDTVDDQLVRCGDRWLAAGARALAHVDGRLRGAVLVLHDITELRLANDGLERRVAERTRELAETQARLVEAAHRAGMAEVAGEILHNIGNVLTSLNVTAAVLMERQRQSVADRLVPLSELASQDPQVRERLPGHLLALDAALSSEREMSLREFAELRGHLDHVAHVVAQQQGVVGAAPVLVAIDPVELLEDALGIALAGAVRRPDIHREYAVIASFRCDRHAVLQILVNLLVNARRALDGIGNPRVWLTIAVTEVPARQLRFVIVDTGCGIAPEHLPRLFDLGFTTRADGHGRGLHTSANAARRLGGELTARSAGIGQGATFTLMLPLDPG